LNTLRERHRSDLIRLRIVRSPFSFLCFLSGQSGGFFVWETLDGTDATYVWTLARPIAYYLDGNKKELRRTLEEVEANIDFIHAAGRNEYLQEKHEKFTRIIHNYQDGDGFLKWKDRIEKLQDGDGA